MDGTRLEQRAYIRIAVLRGRNARECHSEPYCYNIEGDRNSVVSQASCRMDVIRLEQPAYVKIAVLRGIIPIEGYSELYCYNTEGDRNSVVSQALCRMNVTQLEQRAYIKIAVPQGRSSVQKEIVPHGFLKLTVAFSSIFLACCCCTVKSITEKSSVQIKKFSYGGNFQ